MEKKAEDTRKFNINLLIDAHSFPYFRTNPLFFSFYIMHLIVYYDMMMIVMSSSSSTIYQTSNISTNISSRVKFYVFFYVDVCMCTFFFFFYIIGSAERAGYIMNQLLSIIIHSVFVLIYPFSVSLIMCGWIKAK